MKLNLWIAKFGEKEGDGEDSLSILHRMISVNYVRRRKYFCSSSAIFRHIKLLFKRNYLNCNKWMNSNR